MTNRDMERERERREWETDKIQELEELQAKHARIDERLEVGLQAFCQCLLSWAEKAVTPPCCV